MADLHTATIIADVDLLDTVEFPVRKGATTGLLRGTFAKLKTYLKAGLKMTDFSDVDVSTPQTDTQVLVWNNASSKWKPGTVAASGGGSGGGGTINPSVVQVASAVGSTGAVTLPAAPTAGNLLVAVGTHWTNGVVAAAGWTQLVAANGATTDGTIIATKVVTADDTATVTPYGASSSACVTVFEVKDWNASTFQPFNYKQETVGTSLTVNFGVPTTGALLVGHAATISANAAPTSITGAGTTGTTVTGTTTNASPRQVTPFYKAGLTKGGQAITSNYAVSASQYLSGVVICPDQVGSTVNGETIKRSLVQLTADQAITAGTWTDVSWGAAVYDDSSAYSAGTPVRLTVAAGQGYSKARITAKIVWPNNSTNIRYARIEQFNAAGTSLGIIGGDIRLGENESFATIISPWVSVADGDFFTVKVNPGAAGLSLQGDAADFGGRSQAGLELIQGVSIAGSGTAFPSAPVTGQLFYRTDRHMEYFYDGTRWLSKQLFHVAPVLPNATSYAANASNQNRVGVPKYGHTDIYVEKIATAYIITGAGTTWTVGVTANIAGSGAVLGPLNCPVNTSGNHYYVETDIAAVTAGLVDFDFTYTRTLGTGTLYPMPSVMYRLVG